MAATLPVRVLLIDDDEDDYCLTRALLEDLADDGFELEWLPDFDAALETICQGRHDVCLLDYRLGPRTGLDLLRAARERGCPMPVIFLTGQSEREIDFAAMEAGAADYLEKARLDAKQLDRAIRYTLLQKRHADDLEQRVQARTAELAQANAALQAEIAVRGHAEEALLESEARFRHLAEAMPQFVWVINADGTLAFINQQWTEYTGLTLEQSRQRELVKTVVHPDDIAVINAAAARARETGTAYKMEFRLKRASDGVYRWFLGRGVPVKNAEREIIKWYGTSTDIHDQKLVEEAQREAARRKDEFLASMAHELRNPLAPIRNALAIMRLAGNNPDAVERGRAMIERQVSHLVRLIDDLLDVSRISRGKIRLRVEEVEAAQVVQAAVETSRPLIDEAGHHLTLSLPDQPVFLEADPTRLAQVLLNLLNNAAKYTDPGGRIWFSVAQEEHDAVFRVKDTGIGITPDILPHIFEMFTQAGRSEERSQGGLGIGLALVRGLVRLHGGTVEARSQGAGHGAEFIVRLPRKLPPELRPAAGGG